MRQTHRRPGRAPARYPTAADDALDAACSYCRHRLAAVRAGHFGLPTPCTEWTVRDLVNHVLGGQRRYLMLLAGASTAEVERHFAPLASELELP